jgi:hypothetical protein
MLHCVDALFWRNVAVDGILVDGPEDSSVQDRQRVVTSPFGGMP